MKITTIGIDLAKEVFQIHCVDSCQRRLKTDPFVGIVGVKLTHPGVQKT